MSKKQTNPWAMGRHEIPLSESTQNDRHEPCNSYCVGPIPDIDEISVVADQSQKCKRDKKKPFKVHQN